jgi:hypothetical protein
MRERKGPPADTEQLEAMLLARTFRGGVALIATHTALHGWESAMAMYRNRPATYRRRTLMPTPHAFREALRVTGESEDELRHRLNLGSLVKDPQGPRPIRPDLAFLAHTHPPTQPSAIEAVAPSPEDLRATAIRRTQRPGLVEGVVAEDLLLVMRQSESPPGSHWNYNSELPLGSVVETLRETGINSALLNYRDPTYPDQVTEAARILAE